MHTNANLSTRMFAVLVILVLATTVVSTTSSSAKLVVDQQHDEFVALSATGGATIAPNSHMYLANSQLLAEPNPKTNTNTNANTNTDIPRRSLRGIDGKVEPSSPREGRRRRLTGIAEYEVESRNLNKKKNEKNKKKHPPLDSRFHSPSGSKSIRSFGGGMSKSMRSFGGGMSKSIRSASSRASGGSNSTKSMKSNQSNRPFSSKSGGSKSSKPAATSSSPSSDPTSEPSSPLSSMPSIGPSLGPTVQPSVIPSSVPSSEPSLLPSLGPSALPSNIPSRLPSSIPSASPRAECRDYDDFDQIAFNFHNFGSFQTVIIGLDSVELDVFQVSICTALEEVDLQTSIVSCCTSAVLIEPSGRRLQANSTNSTNTTNTVEFSTSIIYEGTSCEDGDTCQGSFEDAINSDSFGNLIGGSVVDLQPLGTNPPPTMASPTNPPPTMPPPTNPPPTMPPPTNPPPTNPTATFEEPSASPSLVPSESPSMSSDEPSASPSLVPSESPSMSSDEPSLVPSSIPSMFPTTSVVPSNMPSSAPSTSTAPTAFVPRAAWMSGKHGIGYRVPGGINSNTYSYNPTLFANQIKDLPISYVIVGLSGGATGDQYISPHPVLEYIGSRNTAPKNINYCSTTIDLSTVADIDVFDNLLVAMENINVKVIAYMGATGPPKLKEGETGVFDFGGDGCYVNAAAECLQFNITNGQCSPSARKWVHWVATNFTDIETYNFDDVYVDGSALNLAAKQAYADVIVGHYAERFGDRIAGYWFDQGTSSNPTAIIKAIRRASKKAVVAINRGIKIPLQNNNPPPVSDPDAGEDYTFGHMVPHQTGTNPVDGCYNYGLVLSAEASKDGYVYPQVSPANTDLSQRQSSNPYVDPNFSISYTETSLNEASLAHAFMPTSETWNGGLRIVWNTDQATEWMKRFVDANGAWTWNVRRRGCAGCSTEGTNPSEINYPDVEFLKSVYAGLPGGSNPITNDYYYNATNCDCVSSNPEGTNRGFGCAVPPPIPNQCQNANFTTSDGKGCSFICKNICGWGTGPITSSTHRCFTQYDAATNIRADQACKCCTSDCREPCLVDGICYQAENCI